MRFRNMGLSNAVHEQALLPRFAIWSLRNTHERHISEAELFEFLVHLADLSQSAVNEQQVGRRNLAVFDPRVTPFKCLTECPVVIAGSDTCDVESSVLFLQWTFRTEHDAGRNCPLAARVADIEAFDARGRLWEIEFC